MDAGRENTAKPRHFHRIPNLGWTLGFLQYIFKLLTSTLSNSQHVLGLHVLKLWEDLHLERGLKLFDDGDVETGVVEVLNVHDVAKGSFC